MDHESKSKAEFLSLAEELRVYILSFLPCRDILRCTSVCKALRQTYMSSSELQYIVELSGQRLLPVHNTDDHAPISERLQLLRDKAHAWFNVNLHSFETVSLSKEMRFAQINVTDGHLYTWDVCEDLAAIIPILPNPSQQTVQGDRWQRTLSSLSSVAHSVKLDVFMDLAQNLIAVLHLVDKALYIDLGALDGDSVQVHPRAAGRTLSLAMPPGSEGCSGYVWSIKMKCFGRHIALRCGSHLKGMWLQIWDWQDSTTSNCFLNGDNNNTYPNEFCFLGNNRFLVLGDELNLYSIEDMSQMPQLLACFSMPVPLQYTSLHPVNDNEYSSQPQMQIQQTTYISDPKHWLLHMTIRLGKCPVFIISTRVFHDLDGMAEADLKPIPWIRWGPSNTRIFERTWASKVQLCGNRVFQAIPLDSGPAGFRLHMMDFSPLAVTNRRGLGRVVKEPSTTDISELSGRPEECLTTSLPFVEVVSDRVFDACHLDDIWIDNDRIYLAQMTQNFEGSYYSTLEVIDV